MGKVTVVLIKDNGCSLKDYRASSSQRIRLNSEMHHYIPAMKAVDGAGITVFKVGHHARQHGASSYGPFRIYQVLFYLLAE